MFICSSHILHLSHGSHQAAYGDLEVSEQSHHLILPTEPKDPCHPCTYVLLLIIITRQEADAATERAEKAEAKLKTTEQELLNREQECQSLKHQLSVRDNELEDTESKLKEAKAAGMAGESNLASVNALQSKIQLLEEELDVAERNAKETMEK